MKNYYRVMLGRQHSFAKQAFEGNFICAGFLKDVDLNKKLPDNWRDFNKEMIPIYLKENPGKKRVAAGLACGRLYTIAKGILIGDTVLCPDGQGNYYVGEITGNYEFHKGNEFPHRRSVKWYPKTIARDELSETFRHSAGSIGTVVNISQYAKEIESLLAGSRPASLIATDETIEEPSLFALEEHLEAFLVENWHHTLLGRRYDIYEEDGEIVGQQYPSDTGPIDILAISKDKKEILVVELKKGRGSDTVVGQVQRYMGYVKDELAEKGQKVRGVIIAFEDDVGMRRALSVARDIEFYTYKVHFELKKK